METIKKILSNKNTLTFVACAVFVLFFLKQCNQIETLKQDIEFAHNDANRNLNNYLASKDSIEVLRNDNGEKLVQIRSYELDLSQLKDSENKLTKKYKDVLDLNKDLQDVNSLISADLEIKDSLLADASVTQIDSTSAEVTYDSFKDYGNGNSRSLFGTSTLKYDFGQFRVLDSKFELKQTLSLFAAIEKGEDGADRLKLGTSYPGIEINNIENINLVNTRLNRKAKKKAGWSIGIGVGYGINLNNNQVISTGPSIGLGVYWSPKFLRF